MCRSIAIRMAADVQCRINTLAAARARELLQLQSKYFSLTKPLATARNQCLRQVPHFWCRALSGHFLKDLSTEQDWRLLQCLEDVVVDEFPSRDGFKTVKVNFDIGHNEIISNASVWLTVTDLVPREVTTSGLVFNPGFTIETLDETDKKSLFRLFESEGNRPKENYAEQVFDFAYCVQTDFWLDPFKYYEIATGDLPTINSQ